MEIYLQIHQYARSDNDDACENEKPADYRFATEKNEDDTDEERNEREPESIVTAPIPKRARDDDAADQQIRARYRHRQADHEFNNPARCAADIF